MEMLQDVLNSNSEVHPYRVEVKVKNNRVWNALMKAVHPFVSIPDAAKKLNVPYQSLLHAISMKRDFRSSSGCRNVPYSERPISKLGVRIAAALGMPPEYLFDAELYRRDLNTTQVFEVSKRTGFNMIAPFTTKAIDVSEEFEKKEEIASIYAAIDMLTPREQEIVRLRFGLDDGVESSLDVLAAKYGVSRERIWQIEAQALRKLRHPARSGKLREYVYCE